MSNVSVEILDPAESRAYWRVFIESRKDLPTDDLSIHLADFESRKLGDKKSFYSVKEGGKVIGGFRVTGNRITHFAVSPEKRSLAPRVIKAAISIANRTLRTRTEATFEESYSHYFESEGFREVLRRVRMEVSPYRVASCSTLEFFHPTLDNAEVIARLLATAYEGHREQAAGILPASKDDWVEFVRSIMRGELGEYLPEASLAIGSPRHCTGVVLTTFWMSTPLVAELAVIPNARGRGFGRALMERAIDALALASHVKVALYVTLGNEPAFSLYRKLGFVEVGAKTITAKLVDYHR